MIFDSNSPALLKALQHILATPEELQRSASEILAKHKSKNTGMTKQELQARAAADIISNASNLCGAVGAVTAIPGGVPGVGTTIALIGGGSADVVLSLKFQVEMAMKLAVVFDHDIKSVNVQLLCLLFTGIEALQESVESGIKVTSKKALTKFLKENLKGALLRAVKAVFAKIGLSITRKSLEKAIPGFVGVVVGFSVNKAMTNFVGRRIRDMFESDTLPDGSYPA